MLNDQKNFFKVIGASLMAQWWRICLLVQGIGRKVMTNLDSILKSRDITLPTKDSSSQSYGFSSSHVWIWELDYKESWALKNWYFWTVLLEKTLESPLDCKEIQLIHPQGNISVLNIHWKDWCWSWNSNTLAIWLEELTHLKRPWCRERLKAGEEGADRGWNGWMASPTQWTGGVWVNSGSWWWATRHGMLQPIHEVAESWTRRSHEINWPELKAE